MKVPVAKKLPSGSWHIQLRLGGQSVSITRPTEKECLTEAQIVKANYLANKQAFILSQQKLTLYDAMTRYIESKDGVLSPSTIGGYYRIRDHHLNSIKNKPIHQLTQEEVQNEVSSLSKNGLSPKTVANVVGLLTPTLKMFAPELNISITLPQKKRYERITPKEEDVAAIANAVRGYAVELPTLLAMCLGLRMSEVLGLKWTDIDGEYIHVQRARIKEGVKLTKSVDGDRWLHIPPYIKELMDKRPHDSEYIVPGCASSVYDMFQRYTQRAGIQHYRFHDLRHLCATVQLLVGADNKAITKRMGWSDDTMLRRIYGHTSQERLDVVSEVTEEYFSSQIAPQPEKNAHENAHEK